MQDVVYIVAGLLVVALVVRVAYPAMPRAARAFGALCTTGVLVYAAGMWVIRDARGDATLAAVPFVLLAVLLIGAGLLVLAGACLMWLLARR